MSRTRAILRRPFAVQQRPVREQDGEVPVRFDAVPVGALFTLRPPKYINLYFVKVNKIGASVADWSDDSEFPSQTFTPEWLVYLVPTNRSRG